MGIIAGLLSMLGWGIADFLAAKSSRLIGNILTFFWMQAVGVFIASIYFLLNFQSFNIGGIPQFLGIIIIIGFLQTAAYLAFYRGLEKEQVSVTAPIGASWVLVTVILSVIFYSEILRINQITAIALIICGTVLVSINIKEILKIKKIVVSGGVKYGVIAALGWGISFFLMVPASKELGWFLPVFLFRIFALLFLTFYILIRKQSFKFKLRSFPILTPILLIGFLDIGAFFSYSFGLRGEHSSIVAAVAAPYVLITIILARIFLKEKFVFNQVLGIISVLAGLVLISI